MEVAEQQELAVLFPLLLIARHGESNMERTQQDLYYAIFFDNKREAKRLLLDPRVDPTADQNCSLWLACELGRDKIVALLLKDKRADPSFNNCYVLRKAEKEGQHKLADLLAEDNRVKYPLPRTHLEEASEHTSVLARLRSGLGATFRREELPSCIVERVDATWLHLKSRWCRADARADKEYYTKFVRECERYSAEPIAEVCRGCGRGYSMQTRHYVSLSHICHSCDFYCQPSVYNPRNAELVKHYNIDMYSDQELPRQLTSNEWSELDWAYHRWKCNVDKGEWTGEAQHDPRLESNKDLVAFYNATHLY